VKKVKKLQQKRGIPIFILLATILMISNIAFAYSKPALDKKPEKILPDILLRYSEYLSQGNATELARIRQEMIEQEKIKSDRIKETNGAVLDFSLMENMLLSWPPHYNFIGDVLIVSDREDFGYVDNPSSVEMGQDNSYAHFHTDGWFDDPEDPYYGNGGEAFVAGDMWPGYALGDVYVHCRRGPHSANRPPWNDYCMISTSTSINGPWSYLGYAQVPSYTATDLYIGTKGSTFNYISIMFWTPFEYEEYNCVEVDNVIVVDWY
jgi:hypothetical protein